MEKEIIDVGLQLADFLLMGTGAGVVLSECVGISKSKSNSILQLGFNLFKAIFSKKNS